MQRATREAGGEAGRRRSARLWRVLVVGGAVLAAACATAPKGGQGSSGGSGDPSSQRDSPQGQPAGGGVSGW